MDDQETVPSMVPIVETLTEAVATTPPPQEVNPAVQTDLTVEVPTQQSQPEPPEQPTHEAHHVDEQVAPTNGNTQESVPGEQQEPAQVNGATTEQETVGTMNDIPAAPVEQEVATDQELAVQPVEIIVQEAAVDDAPAEEAVVVDAAVAIAAGDEAPAADAPAVDALAVEAPAANEPAANPDAVEEAAADAPADGEAAEAADDAESDDDDDDDAAEATPEFFHRCDDGMPPFLMLGLCNIRFICT